MTAVAQADLIVTDMAVIERTDQGLVLRETAPDCTVEDVLRNTEADLIVADDIKAIAV